MSARLDVTREPTVNRHSVRECGLRPYTPPVLEHLGSWNVLTMGQSVCVADFDGVCLTKGGVGRPFIEDLDFEEEW
jgi:hypothetical protein